MTNLFRRKDDVRPLASIPHREGHIIKGVRADGSEALLTVQYVDGFYTVPGYSELVGWRAI